MRALLILTSLGAAAACAPDFVPYNQLDRLRVLAIRSDPVWIGFGETANLTPLLYVPAGESAAFAWSWCPFTAGSASGYACATSEDELQQAIDAALPPGTSFDVPGFDLGTGPTASFANPFPPELLAAACKGLVAESGAPAGVVPDCSRTFPITIRLDVATASESLSAVRELDLIVDAVVGTNQNPGLAELRAGEVGPGFAAAAVVAGDGSTELAREQEVGLFADVVEADAETFVDAAGVPSQERLVLTWFVEAGETERTRTAFAPGRTTLTEARENVWTTPPRAELPADVARVVVVIRDDRGGVGWIERNITLRLP